MTTATETPNETPKRRLLRRFALAAIVTNIGIVFTGGVVRITGSGLGCADWPTCDGSNIAPVAGGDHAGWQAFIEFGNRLLTFVVLAAAVAVVVQMRRTRPHPRSVRWLAWALPAGVLGQAVLGGITVLTGLSPYTVAAHFLLSMVLIAVAVAFHERIRPPDPHPPVARGVQHATTALAVVAFIVLVLGTVVTGAGPHGGDLGAPRFDVDIRLVAIAHADAVWMLIGLTVATLAVTWRTAPPRFRKALTTLLVLELVQGGIGYTQYALGIPPTLVSLHVLGAAVLWAVVSAVWIRARPLDPAEGPSHHASEAGTDSLIAR
jgi:heme a synthase